MLRALDGARLRLHLDGATRVVLNGHAAHVADLAPGLAASARHTPAGRVILLQAVGTRAADHPGAGTIEALPADGLVLRRADGSAVTVAVGPATRVVLRGVPATLADLAPGLTAVVRHRGAEPALTVRAFGRARG